MKTSALSGPAGNRLHTHYSLWFVGDGATTEFRLEKTVGRVDDVAVYVDGVRQRPAEKGTAYDYSIRGLTSGYDGERNAVRLVVAPLATVDVCIDVIST